MKLKLLLITILILTMVEFTLSQSIEFNLVGAGARARGMGGAFIGVADDATAISWNPAGLSRLEKPEASIAGSYESYTFSSGFADEYDIDTDGWNYSHLNLNFISGAVPLSVGTRNLVAAVAFQRVMDMYSKYEEEGPGYEYKEELTGGVNVISPGIGLQLTPTISLGASINIFTGQSEYTEKETGYLDYKYTTDYSGTNFSLGGLIYLNKIRIGAVYKTGFDMDWEYSGDEEGKVTFTMPSMLGLGASLVATENLTLAVDYEMRSFSNAEFESEELGLEDVNQLRFGAEYLLMSGTNIIPLRAGFATTPLPFKDQNDDQITGINLTAGVGLIMGNINLDLGLEYNTYSYETTYTYDGNTYDESDNYLRFLVSGVFHFGK